MDGGPWLDTGTQTPETLLLLLGFQHFQQLCEAFRANLFQFGGMFFAERDNLLTQVNDLLLQSCGIVGSYFDVCEGEGLSFDEMIAFIVRSYGAQYGTVIEEVPPEIWYGQFGKTPDVASEQDQAKRQKMGPSILDALDKIGVKEKERLIRELYAENHRLLEENLAQTMIIEEQKRTNQRLLDCLSQIQE